MEIGDYVDPAELGAVLQTVRTILNHIDLHAADSDDPVSVALLLDELAGVKKMLAETYHAVETQLVVLAGTAQLETPVGVFEILKKKKRTAWQHDELQRAVFMKAQSEGVEPLVLYIECANPTWRVKALRAHGIDPSEFCQEEDNGWSVRLPGKDLEETF